MGPIIQILNRGQGGQSSLRVPKLPILPVNERELSSDILHLPSILILTENKEAALKDDLKSALGQNTSGLFPHT